MMDLPALKLRRGLRRALLSATACAALSVPAAFAQSDSTPNPEADVQTAPPADSGDIVVTAQRRSESLSRVPMSITAATGDELVARGITEVADLQKIVAGFHFSEGTYGAPIYSIRGIGFNDSSLGAKPSVSLSLDEAPLPFPIMAGGVQLDLERVEVAKGPQGILYGQNSTAGAVNYISAKPTDTFAAGADTSIGSFVDFHFQGFVSGPLSNTLRGRVAYSVDKSDGWQKSYTRDDRLGRKNKVVGRVLLDWEPSPTFRVNLNVNGYRDKSDTQASQLILVNADPAQVAQYVPRLIGYPLAPHDDRAADWDADERLKRNYDFYQAILRAELDLTANVTATSITSYSSFDQDRTNDYDGTDVEGQLYNSKGKARVFSQELRVSGNMHPLQWVVGANYEFDKADQDDFIRHSENTGQHSLEGLGGVPFPSNANYSSSRYRTGAVFANIDFDLTSQLVAHAGIRYTKTDFKFNGCAADDGTGSLSLDFFLLANALRSGSGLPPLTSVPANGTCLSLSSALVPGEYFGGLKEDNVSWRAGLDWKPSDDVLFYASATKGYKSGGSPNIAATEQSQFTPIAQESVQAYELGTKVALFDKALRINGAVFYYDYSDKQLLASAIVPAFGALSRLVNVPKSSITGAELGLDWKATRDLTFSLGGTYIKSKIKGDFFNFTRYGVADNFGGEPFPLTPKWQGFADVQYERGIASKLKLYACGNVSYQSATNAALGELPILDIREFATLDLRLGIRAADDRWRIGLWAKNVTDTYYWTNADHVDDTTVRFAGMPRTFGVTAGFRY